MWFPTDGSQEWLNESDAELAVRITQLFPEDCLVGEVGVWKGAWSSVVLMNQENSRVIGIDPYPNGKPAKLVMEKRMVELGVESRFSLFDSTSDIPSQLVFSFVHIDGLHTENAVLSDLEAISSRLAPDGVIVVDDFTSPWFPGVQSALYKFIGENGFRIFLVSMQKAYITRSANAPRMWDAIKNLRDDLKYGQIWENLAESLPESEYRYVQKTDVLGQDVLICSPREGSSIVANPKKLSLVSRLRLLMN
jgi:hypothetical protein